MKKENTKKQLEELKTLQRKNEGKLLNFNQAADYLGFSNSYLCKLILRKVIPFHKPTGRMLIFSKVELDEWVYSRQSTSAEASADRKTKVKSKKKDEISEEEDKDEEDGESDVYSKNFDYE